MSAIKIKIIHHDYSNDFFKTHLGHLRQENIFLIMTNSLYFKLFLLSKTGSIDKWIITIYFGIPEISKTASSSIIRIDIEGKFK